MLDTVLFVAVFVPTFVALRFLLKMLIRPRKPAAPKPPPSPSVRTLLLVIPSDDVLTDGVKSTLIDMWGDLPVIELASKSAVDMAFEFKVTFPDVDDATRLKIAKAVHAAFADDSPEPRKPEVPEAPEPQPRKPEASRRELEELAQRSKSVSGIGASIHGGVYRTLSVSGIDIRVRDVIVLERCEVSGIGASGRVFVAPGTRVDVSGVDARVDVVQLPWAELADRARRIRAA